MKRPKRPKPSQPSNPIGELLEARNLEGDEPLVDEINSQNLRELAQKLKTRSVRRDLPDLQFDPTHDAD